MRPDVKPYFWGLLITLLLSLLLNSGCYKFEGSQTVPTYLKIDSVGLETYYPEQGSASHNITDVWVYVNDGLIGMFELPALFPVLAEGPNELEIRPGIKLNGISSTRVPYPFYKPIVVDNFMFYPDSVQEVSTLVTEYYPNLTYAWMEDFESSSLTLVESSSSDTVIKRTDPIDSPDAYLSENSHYSGVINLTQAKPIYGATSLNAFPMPRQGSPVLMELDFKTNNYLHTGLLVVEHGQFKKIPLIILNHSEDWTKIYINLGPNLSLHPQATEFKVYFEAGLDIGKSSASIYLDNIKLIHRPI